MTLQEEKFLCLATQLKPAPYTSESHPHDPQFSSPLCFAVDPLVHLEAIKHLWSPVIPEIAIVLISMSSSALSPSCRVYYFSQYKSPAKAQSLTFPRACHWCWLPQDHTWVDFIWWITALFYCLSPWLPSLTSYSWNNFIVDNLCILLLINILSNFLQFLICVTVDGWIRIWTHNAKRAVTNLQPVPWTPAVRYAFSY